MLLLSNIFLKTSKFYLYVYLNAELKNTKRNKIQRCQASKTKFDGSRSRMPWTSRRILKPQYCQSLVDRRDTLEMKKIQLFVKSNFK